MIYVSFNAHLPSRQHAFTIPEYKPLDLMINRYFYKHGGARSKLQLIRSIIQSLISIKPTIPNNLKKGVSIELNSISTKEKWLNHEIDVIDAKL